MILAIDTSAKSASCALVDTDGTVVSEGFVNAKLTHSETMMPMLNSVLQTARATLSQVDLLAITNGPGSFTGLRIGIAAVKGLAAGGNIPTVGISTLLATAYNVPMLNGYIIPCMDARRGQVYTAPFVCQNGVITRLGPDIATDAGNILDLATNQNKNIFLLGDGAQLCYNIHKCNPKVHLIPPALRYTRASSVAMAALQTEAAGARAEELTVNYIRLSQAERLRQEREKN